MLALPNAKLTILSVQIRSRNRIRTLQEKLRMQTKRAPIREIIGWAMFDFANSSYTTVIITVVFSVIFTKLIVVDQTGFSPGTLKNGEVSFTLPERVEEKTQCQEEGLITGCELEHLQKLSNANKISLVITPTTDGTNLNRATVRLSDAGDTETQSKVREIMGDYKEGNLWWSIALSLSYLLVVITAPIFGAIMDYSASKKKFLFASYSITIVFTALLYFVHPGAIYLGVALVLLSNFGFAVGESFVSSFLPDLGPPEDLGKISGYAWGLGYFGGLASTIIVTLLGAKTVGNFNNLLFVGPITAIFFMIAAIPTFLFVKERGVSKPLPPGSTYLTIGFKRLGQTFRELKDFRDLAVFMISFFFAYSGLAIVISFAFIYGAQEIHWSGQTEIMMFIITQFTAAGGAVLFGFIQDKIGAIKTFNITLVIWVIGVLLIFGTKEFTVFLNNVLGHATPESMWKAEHVFLFVGCVAGLCLGATQSASRALVGVFSPESKSGEFFGFWGLFGKLAAIFGLLILGVLQTQLGLKTAILVCSVFFLTALIITLFVNEKRGIAAAKEHEGE